MPRIQDLGDYIDYAEAATKLASGNSHEAMRAATELAALEQHAPVDIECSVRTNTYGRAFDANDYKSLQVAWPRLTIPTGKLILKSNDPAADLVLSCEETVVPVVIDIGPLRWSGRVDVAHDKFGDRDDDDEIECELLHDKAWLTRIMAWPWWFQPIQIQGPPSRGVAFGGAVSVIKYLIASQSLRIQLGLWDLVNNLGSLNLDFRSWFGTLLMQNPGSRLEFRDILQAVTTPIYVVPTNPLFDTSPFISLNWRMDDLWTLCNKTCEDNGLTIEVDLWEPGMPQPDALAEATNLLRVPTIVVDVKDRMSVTGFSGTFLDGLQRTVTDLAGSAFGEILKPFLNPGNQYAPEGVNIAPLLGLNFVKPWVLFNADVRDSGLKGQVSHHHPIAWRIITGGKSPKWMNDLIDATLAWLIDMLMIVIGFTGVPGTILDGAFHDIVLAFMLTDNFDRRVKLGPYGFPEKFFPTGSGSYTLDAFFQQKAAMWDTRGYVSGQVICENCHPYELGRDIFPGALASYIRRGKLFTDFIENAVLIDDRQGRAKLQIQIGDGKSEEAPIVKTQRRIVGLQEGVNILLMASQ